MPKADPQWMAEIYQRYRAPLDGDGLDPWQMLAIGFVTIAIAFVYESIEYSKRKTLVPGFRRGVIMGALTALSIAGPLAWVSYRVLATGAIHCVGSSCRHRYGADRYVFMSSDPGVYWATYLSMSVFTVAALVFLFACIRSATHWHELD